MRDITKYKWEPVVYFATGKWCLVRYVYHKTSVSRYFYKAEGEVKLFVNEKSAREYARKA